MWSCTLHIAPAQKTSSGFQLPSYRARCVCSPSGDRGCFLGKEESQRRGPGSGQVLRLGTSPEKEKKNSYFGEEHVLCCLDEGILSFVNVWGLGRCLFFLCVQYCLVNVGREKNGLSMSVRLRGFFASSVTICRV